MSLALSSQSAAALAVDANHDDGVEEHWLGMTWAVEEIADFPIGDCYSIKEGGDYHAEASYLAEA
jgi:hypothetical protein